MKKYIKVYDDVLPTQICSTLISKFELNKDQHIKTDLENHRHFTEININEHHDWSAMVTALYNSLKPYIQKYKEDCNITKTQWPEQYGSETKNVSGTTTHNTTGAVIHRGSTIDLNP